MATIRKRKGKWEVRIRRFGNKTISRTFIECRDAEKWAREYETKLEKGCLELAACGLCLGAGSLCRGACIEYTYNEFNCLVRITYNVFVGGGILAVKPPILPPLSPVSRLSPKTFHAPRSGKLFFQKLQFR